MIIFPFTVIHQLWGYRHWWKPPCGAQKCSLKCVNGYEGAKDEEPTKVDEPNISRYHDIKDVKWGASTRQILNLNEPNLLLDSWIFCWQLIWMWQIAQFVQCSDCYCWKWSCSFHSISFPPLKEPKTGRRVYRFTAGTIRQNHPQIKATPSSNPQQRLEGIWFHIDHRIYQWNKFFNIASPLDF